MSRRLLQSAFKFFGYQVSRYNPNVDPQIARQRWFEKHGVSVVFDVGANSGQYALELRKHGFRGNIVSFEPLSSAFAKLKQNASADNKWQTINTQCNALDKEIKNL